MEIDRPGQLLNVKQQVNQLPGYTNYPPPPPFYPNRCSLFVSQITVLNKQCRRQILEKGKQEVFFLYWQNINKFFMRCSK